MTQSKSTVMLPYELERDILELAAGSPGVAFKLCTLSKYVQPWIEALMYETITLALPFQKSSELFIRTFQVRPATFYANNVKRLYITGIITFDQAQKVIAACSAAREVTCWIYPHTLHENYLQQLPTHHLRRLSINLESLWGIKPLTIDWTSTLFPNLTHLEVVNPPGTYESPMIDWDGLKKLPALTHFALGELFFTHHSFIITPLGKMLVECPHLKVVVIVTRETSLVEKLRKSCILDDRRVVVQSDYNGSLGLDEYWTEVRNGNWDFWAASERDIASGKNIPRLPVQTMNNIAFQAITTQPVAVQ